MTTHAHMQIQYDAGNVEAFVGFDPRVQDDREWAHALLDEFLDHHLIPALDEYDDLAAQIGQFPEDERTGHVNFFTVYGEVDR